MEQETVMAETKQGEAVTNDGDGTVEEENSPVKRGRGRSQGSEVKVASSDQNGSTKPRGRGRPKLSSTKIKEDGLEDGHNDNLTPESRGRGRPKGSKKQHSDKNMAEQSSKKRGRPKKSLSQSTPDLPNGGIDTPKRGRPKGSIKRKLESSVSMEEGATPKKRGRPRGSLKKKPQLEQEVSEDDSEADEVLTSPGSGRGQQIKVVLSQSTTNGISKTPQRGRGRPRKDVSLQPAKRGRGRPKRSSNKMPTAYSSAGRLRKASQLTVKGKKHKRPRLHPLPAKRGRPRKYPLPSPEELKKPKVWKPLGRPRKYPRVDPPEGTPSAPRRSRGRPRKSETKKGAHLRKSLPAAPQQQTYDAPLRNRGRPKQSEDNTPQKKRGRPKGSLNKTETLTHPDGTVGNHSQSPSEATDAAVVEKENILMSVKPEVDAEETLIDQHAGCDVSEQA